MVSPASKTAPPLLQISGYAPEYTQIRFPVRTKQFEMILIAFCLMCRSATNTIEHLLRVMERWQLFSTQDGKFLMLSIC